MEDSAIIDLYWARGEGAITQTDIKYGPFCRKLAFTGQTATLEDRGQIAIVRQNFGFDLENGVTTVALNADTAHYDLEVKRPEQAEAE